MHMMSDIGQGATLQPLIYWYTCTGCKTARLPSIPKYLPTTASPFLPACPWKSHSCCSRSTPRPPPHNSWPRELDADVFRLIHDDPALIHELQALRALRRTPAPGDTCLVHSDVWLSNILVPRDVPTSWSASTAYMSEVTAEVVTALGTHPCAQGLFSPGKLPLGAGQFPTAALHTD